jgi:hypothetical protein
MAQTEKLIHTLLAGDATIQALTTRIYPVLIPQQAAFPCISYQRISGGRVYSLSGYSGLQHSRFQVDCWATGYGGAKDLSYAVKGVMENSSLFQTVLTARPDDSYDDALSIHRVSMDWSIWNS